ncbi:hypothetical protein [Flavobacterium adhaerens]|uniref:hypothetical protein n=1 Tax=Flavobacterium adhaerens TaxID=3149043 RepID=UPI0032B3A531
MIQDIILPLLSIIAGFLYSKWIYKSNGNSFFEETDHNLFRKTQTLKGWFAALILVIAGVLFLIKGISNYL